MSGANRYILKNERDIINQFPMYKWEHISYYSHGMKTHIFIQNKYEVILDIRYKKQYAHNKEWRLYPDHRYVLHIVLFSATAFYHEYTNKHTVIDHIKIIMSYLNLIDLGVPRATYVGDGDKHPFERPLKELVGLE